MNVPFNVLTSVLLAASFLLMGKMFYARAKWYLHMLQLDSYSNQRLVRWIAARPAYRLLDLPRHAVPGGLLLVLLAAELAFSHVAFVVVVASAVLAGTIAMRVFAGPAAEEAKKPLVMTGRARRILYSTMALGLAVFVAVCLVQVSVGVAVLSAILRSVTGSTVLLPGLAAGVTLGANILLVPVQSAINRSYVAKAKANLARINPMVIGITGSYGKTTTKYFLDALVRDSIPTLKTPQSFNTLLGVCRVLNETLRPGIKVFVAEMGAYRPGDIGELAELLHPSVGILTAIGPQHLERFGSIEAVERTKYELIQSLPSDGLAVFNLDDPRCLRLSRQTKQRVMGYGTDTSRGDVDVWAENVRVSPEGMSFEIGTKQWGRTTVQTPVLGAHNVLNILAATCVALHLGIPLDTLRRRMKGLEAAPHRLQMIKGSDGVVIIDDSYNSNPVGAAEALRVLGQFASGKRILITPGMVELGESQESENRRFGELAAEVCDYVFLVAGASSAAIHEGLRAKAFPEERIRALADLSGATAELAKLVQAGDVVLFANDLPDLYDAKSEAKS